MKRILIIFALMFMLTGCGNGISTVTSAEPVNVSMFKVIERQSLWLVVYHRKTKVMYVVSYGTSNLGNFTLLVNPDGTPMLYEGTE